jgi:hypothetical protein
MKQFWIFPFAFGATLVTGQRVDSQVGKLHPFTLQIPGNAPKT